MIQSRQPVPGDPIENCRLPLDAILITIHVLFNSPESKQPELGPTGLVLGLTVVPLGSSLIEPNPFGSTAKLALLQIFAACPQSLATIGGGGGGGQARQLIEIENPGASIIASEVNLSVKHPPVEVIAAGREVPVKGLPTT
jgi:hypothetical protein